LHAEALRGSSLAQCKGQYLMMACRATGTINLQIAAMATRADVLFPTGENTDNFHTANGVIWYYREGKAWGFAPEGETVNKHPCDLNTANGDKRLCWHLESGVGGFRCGNNEILNNDATYERIIYHIDSVIDGVQTNFAVPSGPTGWKLCFSDSYKVILDSKVNLPEILKKCGGSYLLLGCRKVGSSKLQAAAMGFREDVLFDTGTSAVSVHNSNNVNWYNHDGLSWGFAGGSDTVSKPIGCDEIVNNDPQNRLCWPTSGYYAGWRCGADIGLNDVHLSKKYQRVIYTEYNDYY
jgi:hypothetical protein